uniref:Uncharacterized protein n=1 Tax=Kalanchoe fedtschenkoi TaxID=63787 RepID=A0A7N0UX64_KALFE
MGWSFLGSYKSLVFVAIQINTRLLLRCDNLQEGMSYNHVHVSHVRNDDQYPPPGSGYPAPFPGPDSFNPGPPPPPGNFQPPPPPPPTYGGGSYGYDGYQGYFDQGYPPPPPRPLPPQHYNHYQPPNDYDYNYGCDSFLRRCLGFLCCCWLLEACCF